MWETKGRRKGLQWWVQISTHLQEMQHVQHNSGLHLKAQGHLKRVQAHLRPWSEHPTRQQPPSLPTHLTYTSAVGAAARVRVRLMGAAVVGFTLSTLGTSSAWLNSTVLSSRLGVMEMSTAPGWEAGSQVPYPSGSSVIASGVAAALIFCRNSVGEAPCGQGTAWQDGMYCSY